MKNIFSMPQADIEGAYMTNICFLLGGFQSNGGIGRSTAIVANALAQKEDIKVTAICYIDKKVDFLYEISPKLTVRYLYEQNISMAKALLKNHAVALLAAELKKANADVVVACGALYYPLALLAARKTGSKCICWEHTNPAVTSDYKFQNYCRKFAVKKADKIINLTLSGDAYYKKELKAKPDRLLQLYNPVDKAAAVSPEYNCESKKIISVGRLSYPKNFSLLLDVAADVLKKNPGWVWDIFGEGEEREALEAKIKELGLEGLVTLKGQVSDLYSRYGEYAFQVMTSRYEGFPMSLIEGAVNRLPLISFDIATGPSEIITDGENGFLVESENKAQMAEKIEELIKNSQLRVSMSQKAYESALRFDINEITERWCELCRNI